MVVKLADRVSESAQATGTGSFTLGGPSETQYIAFSTAFTTGDLISYVAVQGEKWEIGTGTLLSETQLSRDFVWNTSDQTGINSQNIPGSSLSKISFDSGTTITIFVGLPSHLVLALDENGDLLDPSPFRNVVFIETLTDMKALSGLSDGETVVVTEDEVGGIFKWDATDSTAADNIDTFRNDNSSGVGLHKRVSIRVQASFNGSVSIDAAAAGDSSIDLYTAKKASNPTKYFRVRTDAATSALILGARLNQASLTDFWALYSAGNNSDRVAALKPMVMPSKANAQGMKAKTLYHDTTADELVETTADAADNTTAADSLTVPRVKGTYLLGTYETITDLKAIDAAKYAKTNQRAQVLGSADGGDSDSFFVEWFPSSSDAADDYVTFRPSTGAAASGNGRWKRVIADISKTMTSGDASPSVKNTLWLVTAGSTDITNLDDPYQGQTVTLQRGSVDITIVHDATKIDLGGFNLTLTLTNPRLTLRYINGVWKAIGSVYASNAFTPERFGAKGDGTTDDTVALKALATALVSAGGGTIFGKSNATYLISECIAWPSNTHWKGRGAKIKVAAFASYTPYIVDYGSYLDNELYIAFRNENWDVTALTDSDMSYEDLTFICASTSVTVGGIASWNGHALDHRGVDRLTIRNCRFLRMADAAAHLLCNDTLIEGCYAYQANNCAWDFWMGCTNNTVRSCTDVHCQTAVNFNNALVDPDDEWISDGLLVDGITSWYAFNTAIFIAPLADYSPTRNVTITNSRFYGDGTDHSGTPTTSMIPIALQGVQLFEVSSCTFKGYGNGPFVNIAQYGTLPIPSSKGVVKNNRVDECVSANDFWFIIKGSDILVEGNRAYSSTGYGSIRCTSPTIVLVNNDMPGSTNGIVNSDPATGSPTTPAMHMEFDTANGLFKLNKPLSADISGKILSSGSATDYLLPEIAGSTLYLSAKGASSNLDLVIRAKGTGGVNVTGAKASHTLTGSDGSSYNINSVFVGGITQYGWNLSSGLAYAVDGVPIIGNCQTGWAPDTGTAKKTANATYTAPTISASPTQAEVQAIADALQNATRTIKALKDALIYEVAGYGPLKS